MSAALVSAAKVMRRIQCSLVVVVVDDDDDHHVTVNQICHRTVEFHIFLLKVDVRVLT